MQNLLNFYREMLVIHVWTSTRGFVETGRSYSLFASLHSFNLIRV